jgi:hypothetical protein
MISCLSSSPMHIESNGIEDRLRVYLCVYVCHCVCVRDRGERGLHGRVLREESLKSRGGVQRLKDFVILLLEEV